MMRNHCLKFLALSLFALVALNVRAGTDTDGDGFPDELETGVGTSPTDPASTPFDGKPAGTPQPLSISSLSITLDFAKQGNDALQIAGDLPVPDAFNPAGQIMAVDVGGVIFKFTLDAKGQSIVNNASFGFSTKLLGGAAQNASFAMTIQKGTLASALADEGLDNISQKGVQKQIEVIILFNTIFFQATRQDIYSSTVGKSGQFGPVTSSGGGGGADPVLEVTSFTATPNPVESGKPVTIAGTVKATGVDNAELSGSLNYGDGISEELSSDVLAALKGQIAHTYAADGIYVATLSLTDGNVDAQSILYITVGKDSAVNPIDGMSSTAMIDTSGNVTLQLGIGRVTGATTAKTDFDDSLGRAVSVDGLIPSRLFVEPGISIATSDALDGLGVVKGRVRKTLAVSARSVGSSGALADPPSSDITAIKLTGKFNFTVSSPDKVSFSGQIALPAGFNPAIDGGNSLYVAVGNIADKVTFDAKGKAAAGARITKAQIKYPKLAGATAAGGEIAKLSITISLTDMVTKGFDTEGITASLRSDELKFKAASRTIQIGMVLAGVPYSALAPVSYKVSTKTSQGQFSSRVNVSR